MFPPFFTEDAFEICRQTVKDLQEKKSFLKRVTKKSLERKNQGVMLGSLVCVDKDGTKIVLKAVSGISFQLVEKKKLKNHKKNTKKCNFLKICNVYTYMYIFISVCEKSYQ